MADKSTPSEAPAEAATDSPTGSPAQPNPTLPDGFTELDRKAIDTARVLAMDAVQKVGNGHPGTAMSLAPLAYLLFQNLEQGSDTADVYERKFQQFSYFAQHLIATP